MTTTLTAIAENVNVNTEPEWLGKMVCRQHKLNDQHKKARQEFAAAWNDFLVAIQEVNDQRGTNFSAEQALQEFHGQISEEGFDADDKD